MIREQHVEPEVPDLFSDTPIFPPDYGTEKLPSELDRRHTTAPAVGNSNCR